jgi:AAA+ superfamily predicted ATPase
LFFYDIHISDDLDVWVRANKKQIIREFIRNTEFTKSDNPVAIITAGLPGAGKTEFTQELLKQINTIPLRIDKENRHIIKNQEQ